MRTVGKDDGAVGAMTKVMLLIAAPIRMDRLAKLRIIFARERFDDFVSNFVTKPS